MSQTMSGVEPPYDVDPRKPPLPALVGIIQNLNRQLENASRRLNNLQKDVEKAEAAENKIRQRYYALLDVLMCESCQSVKKAKQDGKTFTLCLKCSRIQDREILLADALAQATAESNEWRRSFETLQIKYERHVDGPSGGVGKIDVEIQERCDK